MFLRPQGDNLGNSKRNFFVFAGVLAAVLALVSGGYVGWQRYFSKEAKDLAAFQDYQKQVEEAYRNDTYGGATPEETLRLFVEALKKEDVELASKYFALDDNLSKEKWIKALQKAKDDKRLADISNLLSKAQPGDNSNEKFRKAYYSFVVYDDVGILKADITLEFNPVSKVWKIESL